MNILTSKIDINIKGKHLDRFIQRLMRAKIELLNIKYISKEEMNIRIYKDKYEHLMKIKSIYKIKIVNYYGIIKIKKRLIFNRILIAAILVGFGLLIFLSNIIFDVQVIHNSAEIRRLVLNELEGYDIKKHSFIKSYDYIQKVKKGILKKYKNKIEWLEIENIGTKYIVRVEERKIIDIKDNNTPQNIVATKSAIIKKVISSSGVIIRNTNDYVKEGDIVISGQITPENKVRVNGVVYGEVWYNISVSYPFHYREEKITGREKKVLSIQFLNHSFSLDFNRYKDKKVKNDNIIKHPFLPISLVRQTQTEIEVTDKIYTLEEAIHKADVLGRSKMEEKLSNDEYIISEKQLKVDVKDSKIEVDIFYSVYEDITGYQVIVEEVKEDA
ncbi:MAG: sporulation protein YqfD [Ignavibacteriales bacterium]